MIKFILSLVPLAGTTVGSALGIFDGIYNRFKKEEDFFVAAATGILLSINVSLLLEGVTYISKVRSLAALALGILLGILFIMLMNRMANTTVLHHKLIWAMFIHNIPEGILIGIALADGHIVTSISLVFSITLQNLPDGMVVSMPLVSRLGKRKAFLAGVFSGIVEPIAAIAMLVLSKNATQIQRIEPFLIGFSLATISLIAKELLAECSNKKIVTLAAIANLAFLCLS